MEKRESAKKLNNFYTELQDADKDVRNKNLYNLLISKVTGENVLDIGSGAGHFLAKLQLEGFKAEGVEPDKNLLELSKNLYNNSIKVHEVGAENVDSINEKFDTITMIDVLEHIKNDSTVLRNVANKLNPGGRLVILVPAYQFLYTERDKEIGHFRRYSPSQLRRRLSDSGYKIVEMRTWNVIGFFAYLMFEKMTKKKISRAMRTGKKKGTFKKITHKILDYWMGKIENKINFGFGLSIICIATKK